MFLISLDEEGKIGKILSVFPEKNIDNVSCNIQQISIFYPHLPCEISPSPLHCKHHDGVYNINEHLINLDGGGQAPLTVTRCMDCCINSDHSIFRLHNYWCLIRVSPSFSGVAKI